MTIYDIFWTETMLWPMIISEDVLGNSPSPTVALLWKTADIVEETHGKCSYQLTPTTCTLSPYLLLV